VRLQTLLRSLRWWMLASGRASHGRLTSGMYPAGAAVPRCTGCTWGAGLDVTTPGQLCRGTEMPRAQHPSIQHRIRPLMRRSSRKPHQQSKHFLFIIPFLLPRFNLVSVPFNTPSHFHSPRPHRSSSSHSSHPPLSSHSVPLPLRPGRRSAACC
jgi:hypothetical protein